MKLISLQTSFALFLVVMSACGSETGTDSLVFTEDTSAVKSDHANFNTHEIFHSIPSTIETAQLIQKAGALYNKDVLNDIDNAAKYTSKNSRALNLGTYGSDLSYTSIFDQSQESILYLKCAKKLADGLGISGAFTEQTVERMQANYGNQDSLLNIISDSYSAADEYLKENQNENTAVLIIAGGWIEGLYIGTQLVKSTKNNSEIITRITGMKASLQHLLSLLELCKNEAGAASIIARLKEIKSVYDEMKTKPVRNGGAATYSLTSKQLEKITTLAEQLRTEIIKM